MAGSAGKIENRKLDNISNPGVGFSPLPEGRNLPAHREIKTIHVAASDPSTWLLFLKKWPFSWKLKGSSLIDLPFLLHRQDRRSSPHSWLI